MFGGWVDGRPLGMVGLIPAVAREGSVSRGEPDFRTGQP
jgi:hypothetical protein